MPVKAKWKTFCERLCRNLNNKPADVERKVLEQFPRAPKKEVAQYADWYQNTLWPTN